MSLKTERDLNANTRNLYSRARLAEQSKNYEYAISLMQTVLREEPLFLKGRLELRVIEIQRYKALNSFSKQMLNMKVAPLAMKLSSKKEPTERLVMAEEVLALDPYHQKANVMVGDAGTILGYPDFKTFAYETLAEGNPKDKAILNTLALAYMEMQSFEKAEKTYARILDLDKRDGDALSGMKAASAALAGTHWKKGSGDDIYRSNIKDIKVAEQLEAEAKAVKSSEGIESQIQLNYARYEAEPNNPLHAKAIAKLYEQKADFASAISWYEAAFNAGGKIDSSLEKTIGDLRLRNTEQELQTLRSSLTEQTDPEQQAQYEATIVEKEKELNDVRLFLAEARVKAQPNEGEFRYDLGQALYKVGQYKRAVEELQQSLKQPSVRYQALNLMGMCFMKRNMLDFAVKQLALAQSELLPMDDIKKEITYNLGLAYEMAKQPEKSLDQWKMIYEYDMTYRDVAQRVEDSYGQNSAD